MAGESGIAGGVYYANQYKLDWSFVDVLPQGNEITDWWVLKSKSLLGVDNNTTVLGTPWIGVNAVINNNSITFNANSYYWHIYATIGGQQLNKFLPHYAPYFEFYYSLHVHNTTLGTSNNDKISNSINLYPNPTNDLINIEFELNNPENIYLTIYDLQGKAIATPTIGEKAQGKHKVSIRMTHLPKGIYLIQMNIGKEIITKKIVKL